MGNYLDLNYTAVHYYIFKSFWSILLFEIKILAVPFIPSSRVMVLLL